MNKTFEIQNTWKGRWRYFISEDGMPVSQNEQKRLLMGEDIGRKVRVFIFDNVITTGGRQRINEGLAGQIASVAEVKITKQQLGTGTNAPTASDTALQTPSAGTLKNISSVGVNGAQVNITSFWAAGEAIGTWKEHGTFINDTLLFSRVAIDIIVGASEALTVDGTVTQSL